MAGRGAGGWEIRLSGSVRGWVTTQIMGDILWHRRETRRQTEKTNLILPFGEFPAYSKVTWQCSPAVREPRMREALPSKA